MPAGDGIDSTGRWRHEVIERVHRYSLSTEVATGRRQLQVEIAAGPVDYEVTEDLDDTTFAHLIADPASAQARAAELREAEWARRRGRPDERRS